MKFTLLLTHGCNLCCNYCYGGTKNSKRMSVDVGKQSIDFAFSAAQQDEALEFSFFGGEPLLCAENMRFLVSTMQSRADEEGRLIRLSITTNGTLLDETMIDFIGFCGMDLCISVDGPQHVHDQNRRYPSGEGSFRRVINNLRNAVSRLPRVQVNAVYSPETLEYLPEVFDFFLSENIPVVHFNPDITACWSIADLERISDSYEKLADSYLNAFRNGLPVAVNLFDSKMILFMNGGYTKLDVCGMGQSELAVAPSGNIFPCERLVADDTVNNFVIGHVATGFAREQRFRIIQNRGNSNAACRECEINRFCMNWCGCTNYRMTGMTNKVGPMLCVSERAVTRAADRVFKTLAAENNEAFFGHFMQYAVKECHEQAVC